MGPGPGWAPGQQFPSLCARKDAEAPLSLWLLSLRSWCSRPAPGCRYQVAPGTRNSVFRLGRAGRGIAQTPPLGRGDWRRGEACILAQLLEKVPRSIGLVLGSGPIFELNRSPQAQRECIPLGCSLKPRVWVSGFECVCNISACLEYWV